MGDAISSAASALPAVDIVAGYDTGTFDIRWTAATFAQFPGLIHVHIDQGGPGAPVYSANVIDVETAAWSPGDVPGWIARCTAPVPTVYCNRSNLPAVLATGWRGPVWLAFPGWQPGQPLPVLPAGCRYVAIQNVFQASYDLSAVLDPNWPLEAPVSTPQFPLSDNRSFAVCVYCASVFFNEPPFPGNGNHCQFNPAGAGEPHWAGNSGSGYSYAMTAVGLNP